MTYLDLNISYSLVQRHVELSGRKSVNFVGQLRLGPFHFGPFRIRVAKIKENSYKNQPKSKESHIYEKENTLLFNAPQ